MSQTLKASFLTSIIILFFGFFVCQSFFLGLPTALAQAGQATPSPTPSPTSTPELVQSPHADSSKCLSCHSESSMLGTFADGTTISLSYDPGAHPKEHMPGCVACHRNQRTYPHENSDSSSCAICHWRERGSPEAEDLTFQLSYPDQRALSVEISESCKKCHKPTFTESADSIHSKILDQGNRYAPICVDCHDSHDIVPGSLTRQSSPAICSKCHLSTYTAYMSSAHGSAPGSVPNEDLPTCEDCHGVHDVHGPSDGDFRANSVEVCGACHADEERMAKYGISTNVYQTYLNDFHGRAVDFDRQSNMTYIPEATCYDCHGIHNVQSVEEASSAVAPQHLQETCQQCHIDAGPNFSQAWLGHVTPDQEKTPALFGVIRFYQLTVPVIMSTFLIYILLDAQRRIIDFFQRRKSK